MIFSSQEKYAFKKGYRLVAGIDEVGRGALAGPVAAAIVALKGSLEGRLLDKSPKATGISKLTLNGVPRRTFSKTASFRDSKLLTPKQREEIFEIIKNEPSVEWRVSFVWPKVIDRINIWQATLLAWRRCLQKLNPRPDFLFLDGRTEIPGLEIAQRAIVKGDQKIALLSLASIVAKVSRDKLMERLEKKYSQYSLAQHKGYGTRLHFERLVKFGPSEIHRRSFQPVFKNLSFKDKVYYVVSRIPSGQVMTYQQVARRIGQPRAYRAVGNVLNKNPSPFSLRRTGQVPCHRIIRSDGQIGGFGRGRQLKIELLRREGYQLDKI
jgi:ribonuclease HII